MVLHLRHDRPVALKRDVRPENILLAEGHALGAGFGISRALTSEGPGERITESGLTVGTPAYMSPEQSAGEPTGSRSRFRAAETYGLPTPRSR
jgi:serine/threonine protein kinase